MLHQKDTNVCHLFFDFTLTFLTSSHCKRCNIIKKIKQKKRTTKKKWNKIRESQKQADYWINLKSKSIEWRKREKEKETKISERNKLLLTPLEEHNPFTVRINYVLRIFIISFFFFSIYSTSKFGCKHRSGNFLRCMVFRNFFHFSFGYGKTNDIVQWSLTNVSLIGNLI